MGKHLILHVSTIMFHAALSLLSQERTSLLKKKSMVGIYLFSVGFPVYAYFENRRHHNFLLDIVSAVFV